MSQTDIDIVKALFVAWNDGDIEDVKARFAEDVEWNEVGGRLDRPQSMGREELAKGLRSLFDTWQSYRLEPEELHPIDGRVLAIVREVARGRTSGLEVASTWGYVITVRDGKVAYVDAYRDPAKARAAAGVSA